MFGKEENTIIYYKSQPFIVLIFCQKLLFYEINILESLVWNSFSTLYIHHKRQYREVNEPATDLRFIAKQSNQLNLRSFLQGDRFQLDSE